MNAYESLSTEFSAWVRLANWDIIDQGDTVVVASPGGEIRFLYRVDRAGVFSVARAERAESERPVLWSNASLVPERYLTAEIGDEVRSKLGLPQIVLPLDDDSVPPSIRIIPGSAHVLELVGTLDGTLGQFSERGYPEPIVQYSHYANASLSELRASFLDSNGAPVFSHQTKRV